MIICKKCDVELDEEMASCPLCGTPVNEVENYKKPAEKKFKKMTDIQPDEKHMLQRILWQVVSILLFSGIIATLIIDIGINKRITWSVYPISLCMIVFSYASFLAFWHTKTIYQILGGWILSSVLLIFFNSLFPNAQWTIYLGIPILFATNLISIALIGVFRVVKRKGLNLLAFTFVGIAVLCITIEGIIDYYFLNAINLRWSIIVAACLLPVTTALIFMFQRTKNNTALQKIFHT